MRNIKFYFVLVLFFAVSCEKENECEGIDCIPPVKTFTFDMVDKTTGENVFTNGTFSRNQISIINLLNDQPIDYEFIDIDNLNYIKINSIGWQTEIVNCSISIDSEKVCGLYLDAERVSEDCCSFMQYNEISIEDCEFEYDSTAYLYKIFIE